MLDLNDYLLQMASLFERGYENFSRNAHSFATMSLKQWIRIIAIIGGYLLLRPYLTKLAEASQRKQLAKPLSDENVDEVERKKEELGKVRNKAVISPNVLRGVELPVESDSEEEGKGEGGVKEGKGKATGRDVKWGAKAKKRQRALVEKIIRQEEEARKRHIANAAVDGWDSEEDKDIEMYLQ